MLFVSKDKINIIIQHKLRNIPDIPTVICLFAIPSDNKKQGDFEL